MDKELLFKYLKCETTPDEENRVVEWVGESPENRRQLDAMQVTLNALSVQRMSEDRLLGSEVRRLSIVRRARRFAAVAASLVFAAGIGFGLASILLDRQAGQSLSVEVPAGQRMSITLGDGTLVWLNSGTTMEYPSVFSKKIRKVKVCGEAMFEVEHDANHPFVVETFACDLEVLGTKFNVQADEGAGVFSAALMEGSVKLTGRFTGGEPIIMKPDEEVTLVNGELKLNKTVNPDEYLWPEGILSIKNTGFEDMMAKFEQIFGVEIEIKLKQIPEINLNRGKIRVSDGIDHALSLIQLAAEFKYQKDFETGIITIY